jgi:hypothetical protein
MAGKLPVRANRAIITPCVKTAKWRGGVGWEGRREERERKGGKGRIRNRECGSPGIGNTAVVLAEKTKLL